MGCLRIKLSKHAKRGRSQECFNCGACKESVENVLFDCASDDIQRQFLDCLNQVLPDAFEAFLVILLLTKQGLEKNKVH